MSENVSKLNKHIDSSIHSHTYRALLIINIFCHKLFILKAGLCEKFETPHQIFLFPHSLHSFALCLLDLPSNAWSNTVCTALLQRSAMVNTCIKQIFQLIRLTYIQVTSVTPKPTLQNSQNAQFKKVFSFPLLMSV